MKACFESTIPSDYWPVCWTTAGEGDKSRGEDRHFYRLHPMIRGLTLNPGATLFCDLIVSTGTKLPRENVMGGNMHHDNICGPRHCHYIKQLYGANPALKAFVSLFLSDVRTAVL